jgi:hypothetical protein
MKSAAKRGIAQRAGREIARLALGVRPSPRALVDEVQHADDSPHVLRRDHRLAFAADAHDEIADVVAVRFAVHAEGLAGFVFDGGRGGRGFGLGGIGGGGERVFGVEESQVVADR